jgi:hypothetical protein
MYRGGESDDEEKETATLLDTPSLLSGWLSIFLLSWHAVFVTLLSSLCSRRLDLENKSQVGGFQVSSPIAALDLAGWI